MLAKLMVAHIIIVRAPLWFQQGLPIHPGNTHNANGLNQKKLDTGWTHSYTFGDYLNASVDEV